MTSHHHLASVQFGVCLHDGESYACASLRAFGLEESFKYLFAVFLRYSLAGIAHADKHLTVGHVAQRHHNGSSGRSELHGIADEVEDDAVYLLLIANKVAVGILVCVYLEVHVFLLHSRIEVAHPLSHLFCQTEIAQMQFHVAVLYFPEVHDVVNEPPQGIGVAAHDDKEVSAVFAQFFVFEELFHGVYDERERSAQLMAHIGKESETRLCERYHFGIELVQLFVAFGELLRELAFCHTALPHHHYGCNEEHK